MSKTLALTNIRNTSIKFDKNGFTIIEPIDEHFLFHFGMEYGKLVNEFNTKNPQS